MNASFGEESYFNEFRVTPLRVENLAVRRREQGFFFFFLVDWLRLRLVCRVGRQAG